MSTRRKGIDVSHWNLPGSPAIRDSAAVFGWLKVSQGARGRDVRAAAHHAAFGQLGMDRGAYHFTDTRATPEANARNFLTAMGALHFELRPMVDLEHNQAGLGPQALAEWALRLAELVEAGCGVRPVFYTYASWWNPSVAPLLEFRSYVLWVARYPNAYKDGALPADDVWTAPAHPWDAATIWQFSTFQRLDRNLVDAAAYPALLSTATPPLPNPDTGDFTMDADAKARFDHLEQQVQTLLDTTAKKAVALRSKKDGKVWIVTDEGRWHVPDMETLNVLIYVGQVHGLGTDGKVAEVTEAQLDGIPVLAGPK